MIRDLNKARQMLIKFTSGDDVSQEYVGSIGVYFDVTFGEEFDIVQELVIAAACYEPNGGPFLFDEKDFFKICERVLAFIDRLGN